MPDDPAEVQVRAAEAAAVRPLEARATAAFKSTSGVYIGPGDLLEVLAARPIRSSAAVASCKHGMCIVDESVPR